MRLLTLVHKQPGRSPGQRFRLEQWAPILRERHGIELRFSIYESPASTELLRRPGHRAQKAWRLLGDTARRRHVLDEARDFDGVVVYREAAMLGPALFESLLARRGVPIVYDFDDAIWLRQPGSVNGAFAALRFPGKTKSICRQARAVTVGNEYLADWARRFNRAVSVVPTSIDLDRFGVQPELGDDEPLVIVWTGSFATLPHLELLRGALARVGARRRVVLKVICDRAPARPFEGVEQRFIPWRAESEAEDVGAAHLGIMPLPDDSFARGKCACKALQYMATGRPAIASPVGVNREIIRPGENGLLCASDDEWVAAIESLASSPALRRRLGAAGRRTVEIGYSATSSAARFADAARAAVESR